MPPAGFDVFISYNRADQPQVLKLAAQLRNSGLNPWLDVWNLVPGEPWLPAVERALSQSAACAVIVGPSGLGGVHEQEMWTAIEHSLSTIDGHSRYRVIPTLLPHATRGNRATLPRFFSRYTWIEFQQSLDEPEILDRLVKAIRGEAPGAKVAGLPGICPYRGLAHFEIGDAPLFFGREALGDWLLSRLRGTATKDGPTRFLAIVGASGSGKSSLARAGLLAKLKQGELPGSSGWPIVVCRPENRPLETLASALANTEGLRLGTGLKSEHIAQLETSLLRSSDALHKFTVSNIPPDDPAWRLVVFVDQFEELFTLNPLPEATLASAAGSAERNSLTESRLTDDRIAYVRNLLRAATIEGGRTIVIMTMRADFYGKCALLPELATAVSQHQELVGPMSADELRRAIETPARLSGSDIEPGLVDLLVGEVAAQPGALPLLQYALAELWQKSKDLRQSQMTSTAYRELGGWEGALSRRADAVVAAFRGTPKEALCRQLFLRLVQPGEGTEDTKRLVSWQELQRGNLQEAAELEATLRQLVESRLITAGGESLRADSTVEVIHEALIRGWAELRKWLDADRAGLRTHRQLTDAANEWARSQANVDRRDGWLLYSGTRLAMAQELAKRGDVALNDIEQQFLAASLDARASRRRRTWLAWTAVAVAAILLPVIIMRVAMNSRFVANEMVASLMSADVNQVPGIVDRIGEYRRWANEPLWQMFNSAAADSSVKLHAALALAPVAGDGAPVAHLRERLLRATPSEFAIIRDALAKFDARHAQHVSQLWDIAKDRAIPAPSRFRAACALATFLPSDSRWSAVAPVVASYLVGLPATELAAWRDALRPVRASLQEPLASVFREQARGSPARQNAGEILADYAADNPQLLAELLLVADPQAFEPLLAALNKDPTTGIERFRQELEKTLRPQWEELPPGAAWKSLEPSVVERIRQADGLIDERWAVCLSLPAGEIASLCSHMRGTGFRPISVVTSPRDGRVLAAIVWLRDGANWDFAGPVAFQEALRLDELHRQAGLAPWQVNRVPPSGEGSNGEGSNGEGSSGEGSSGEELCVIWGPRPGQTGGQIEQPAASSSTTGAMPLNWSVKMFRFDPGKPGQPPPDWVGIISGEPFSDREEPNLEINYAADQAAAKQMQNLALSARRSIELEAGAYQLCAIADEGLRVYLDDQLVVDRWTGGQRAMAVVEISADSGTHELRVENYQLDGHWKLAVHLGLPRVELNSTSTGAPAGSTAQSADTPADEKFENAQATGIDPHGLAAELKKLIAAGYRPFSVHSVTPQLGQPTCLDVLCRRPAVQEEDKDSHAQKQSHAAIALARLGQPEALWPRLVFDGDPRLQTELIHDLADYQVDVRLLLERLELETIPSARRALLLALGRYPEMQLTAERRSALVPKLLQEYAAAADSGLHAAVEWLLRTWNRADDLNGVVAQGLLERESDLQNRRAKHDKRRWYVNSQGQTFVIFPPGHFQMGSPELPQERHVDEWQHWRRIERPFAIASTEITRDQYLKFVKATGARDPSRKNPVVKTPDSPQTGVEWIEAARYCNWLSHQEGIPPEQWCYDENANQENAATVKLKTGFLDLAGYRLPTEAEWEYACRAATLTARYYGQSEVRLPEYCWYLADSRDQVWPVGLKKPNEAGLFDMLGNAYEWCQEKYGNYPHKPHIDATMLGEAGEVHASDSRVLRGGSFVNRASDARSAARNQSRPGHLTNAMGFRPARTYPYPYAATQ